MKTVQKLEIVFGLATLVGTLTVFYIVILRFIVWKLEKDEWDEIYRALFFAVIFIIAPGLMVGIGSVAHSIRKSSIGLNAVKVGGSILILYFGLSFLGFAVWTGWLGGFILSTPGLLAAITMYLAYRAGKKVEK